jgi:hypothetical protein
MSAFRQLLFVALLSFLVSSNCYSQENRPDAALNTVVGSIGISDVESQMLLKEVRSKLDDHYRLISSRLFDQAYEKWEEQIQSEEQCTSEKCIRFIQDNLQIERLFSFSVMRDGNLTQLSIAVSRIEDTLSETAKCDDCSSSELLDHIENLIINIVKADLEGSPPLEKINKTVWQITAISIAVIGAYASYSEAQRYNELNEENNTLNEDYLSSTSATDRAVYKEQFDDNETQMETHKGNMQMYDVVTVLALGWEIYLYLSDPDESAQISQPQQGLQPQFTWVPETERLTTALSFQWNW